MTSPFDKVSPEIFLYLLKFAGCRSFAALARTNRHLHNMCNPIIYRSNLTDIPMNSCVLWAASNGRLETLTCAQAHGADLNVTGARDKDDLELNWDAIPGRRRFFAGGLHLSIQKGHEDIFRFLLDQEAELDSPARAFCSCRDQAWNFSHLDSHPYEVHWYPLHTAICHQQDGMNMAKELIRRGAYRTSRDFLGLHEAVARGNIELVDLLLKSGHARASDTNIRGETALHYIAKVEDANIIKAVVAKFIGLGVSVDTRASSGTALELAVRQHNYEAALVLLQHGADATAAPIDKYGNNLLHLALGKYETDGIRLQKGIELVSSLIDAGVDMNLHTLNQRDSDGPPLWCAVTNYTGLGAMKLLLERGARVDVSITNKISGHEGQSTIIGAMFHHRECGWCDSFIISDNIEGDREKLKVLLRYGARIDPLEDEVSALMIACEGVEYGYPEVLEAMLEAASKNNVSLEHLLGAVEAYVGDDGVFEDVRSMLEAFIAREYPETWQNPGKDEVENVCESLNDGRSL